MKIKGEHLYNTMELMDILDFCTEVEEFQIVDRYIVERQSIYKSDLVSRIRIHIHNSIKYIKHGGNI